jgi:hypothetical protein
MTAVLVDTNLLVYAWDPADAHKQERAIATLDGLHSAGLGRLSAQSLAVAFDDGEEVPDLARARPVRGDPSVALPILQAHLARQ